MLQRIQKEVNLSQVWTIKIVGRYYELLDEDDNSIHITSDRNIAYLLEDICKRHNAVISAVDKEYDDAYKSGYAEGWDAACSSLYPDDN